jgi:predicted DNA-binding protein
MNKIKSKNDPFSMTNEESGRFDKSKHLVEVAMEMPSKLRTDLLQVSKKKKGSINAFVKTAIHNFLYELEAKQDAEMESIPKKVLVKIPQEMFAELVLIAHELSRKKDTSVDELISEAVRNELEAIQRRP